jgi:hypothetical protein
MLTDIFTFILSELTDMIHNGIDIQEEFETSDIVDDFILLMLRKEFSISQYSDEYEDLFQSAKAYMTYHIANL